VVANGIVGFFNDDVKLFGPVQANLSPGVESKTFNDKVVPEQVGLFVLIFGVARLVITLISLPLSGDVKTGELATILIRYPVPAAETGKVQLIVPDVVAEAEPMFKGLKKLPVPSDS